MATRITVTIETIGAGGDPNRVQILREVEATAFELNHHVTATADAAFSTFTASVPPPPF